MLMSILEKVRSSAMYLPKMIAAAVRARFLVEEFKKGTKRRVK